MNLNKLNQLEAYDVATNKIKELYKSDGGKKFIHHLIYAFTSGVSSYVLTSRRTLKDCLSKSALNTVYSKDNPITDPFILTKIEESKKSTDPEERQAIWTAINDRVIDLIGENSIPRVAITSELTNKVIGLEELQALIDFIKSEVSEGNETITKMARYALYVTRDSSRKNSNKSRRKKSKSKKLESEESNDTSMKSKLEALKNKYSK